MMLGNGYKNENTLGVKVECLRIIGFLNKEC